MSFIIIGIYSICLSVLLTLTFYWFMGWELQTHNYMNVSHCPHKYLYVCTCEKLSKIFGFWQKAPNEVFFLLILFSKVRYGFSRYPANLISVLTYVIIIFKVFQAYLFLNIHKEVLACINICFHICKYVKEYL